MSAESIGQTGFIAAHGLWSDAERARADAIEYQVEKDGIEAIRFSFADQHGVLRGKAVMARALGAALRNGCTITTTLLLKDTSHRTVFPVWQPGAGLDMAQLTGGADVIMVPLPHTFRPLPWAPRTAWLQCDLYFRDGTPVPFSTRSVCARLAAELDEAGYDYLSGLELECQVFRLDDPKLEPRHATQPGAAPEVSLLGQGFQYLTEARLDELDPVLEILRGALNTLGLPLRTLEVEFGPSQIELTFDPCPGIATADNAVLVRSAVKQVCRRHGLLATFMCRPQGENLFSSGWHLHQSLWNRDGTNAFTPDADDHLLSPLGASAAAGLLRDAAGACVLTTPTLNGYKRYQPFSLAPDRIAWGRDNRGTMLRVVGGPGDPGTRIENRVGEPAANPYLYLSAQIASMLSGIREQLSPPPPVDSPYEAPAGTLPAHLGAALEALDASVSLRSALGATFVDYLLAIKRAELARFHSTVTDWEQREYLNLF